MSDLIDRHRALINQIRWERDTAIAQLSQIGKGLGERMDDVAKVVRCRDCKHYGAVVGFVDDYCHKADWHRNRQLPDDFCSQGERRTDETD